MREQELRCRRRSLRREQKPQLARVTKQVRKKQRKQWARLLKQNNNIARIGSGDELPS